MAGVAEAFRDRSPVLWKTKCRMRREWWAGLVDWLLRDAWVCAGFDYVAEPDPIDQLKD